MKDELKHRIAEPKSIDCGGAIMTTAQIKCSCCLSTHVHRTDATVHEHEDVHVVLECTDCLHKSLVRVFGDGDGGTHVQVVSANPIEMMRPT